MMRLLNHRGNQIPARSGGSRGISGLWFGYEIREERTQGLRMAPPREMAGAFDCGSLHVFRRAVVFHDLSYRIGAGPMVEGSKVRSGIL